MPFGKQRNSSTHGRQHNSPNIQRRRHSELCELSWNLKTAYNMHQYITSYTNNNTRGKPPRLDGKMMYRIILERQELLTEERKCRIGGQGGE